MVGDLVGLLVSNNATLVRLQKVEACANLSVQEQRARCHIGGSMRRGAISEQEIRHSVREGKSVLITGFHCLLKCLYQALSGSIGGRMIGYNPDMLDGIDLGVNSSEVNWGPLSDTICSGRP